MAINKDFLLGYGAGKAAGGGGGGNPNAVFEFESTLQNPFGPFYTMMDQRADTVNGEIEVDASILGFEDPVRLLVDNTGAERIFAYLMSFEDGIPNGIAIEWWISYDSSMPDYATLTLLYAYYYVDGVAQDMSDSLDLFPTVLRVFTHPMP